MGKRKWKFRRPGGNARALFDPLGWRIDGAVWPLMWLSWKFPRDSRARYWLHEAAQWYWGVQFYRRLRKHGFGQDK